mmetsp:Transcript_112445/g.324858  ORF Transcript_112445/g.324858 Transcript_112445/m.324858 type:complete len:372 (+) Transcript_112445:39-1154(+)
MPGETSCTISGGNSGPATLRHPAAPHTEVPKDPCEPGGKTTSSISPYSKRAASSARACSDVSASRPQVWSCTASSIEVTPFAEGSKPHRTKIGACTSKAARGKFSKKAPRSQRTSRASLDTRRCNAKSPYPQINSSSNSAAAPLLRRNRWQPPLWDSNALAAVSALLLSLGRDAGRREASRAKWWKSILKINSSSSASSNLMRASPSSSISTMAPRMPRFRSARSSTTTTTSPSSNGASSAGGCLSRGSSPSCCSSTTCAASSSSACPTAWSRHRWSLNTPAASALSTPFLSASRLRPSNMRSFWRFISKSLRIRSRSLRPTTKSSILSSASWASVKLPSPSSAQARRNHALWSSTSILRASSAAARASDQ